MAPLHNTPELAVAPHLAKGDIPVTAPSSTPGLALGSVIKVHRCRPPHLGESNSVPSATAASESFVAYESTRPWRSGRDKQQAHVAMCHGRIPWCYARQVAAPRQRTGEQYRRYTSERSPTRSKSTMFIWGLLLSPVATASFQAPPQAQQKASTCSPT